MKGNRKDEKIDNWRVRVLGDLTVVDTIITDYEFSQAVRDKFPNTEFITVQTPKSQL